MRGTGKTYIGNLASSALSWPCIDADKYLEEKHNIGVREFVQQHGWEEFRAAELAVLKELIKDHATGCILSLGGGIVESLAAREVLKEYRKAGPVVHVVRPLEDIVTYLSSETDRPAYGESISEVYQRRASWYAECRNFIFDNMFGEGVDEKSTFAEVVRFFRHISGVQPNLAANLAPGRRSYFLSLTYPDIKQAIPHIDELTQGVDALELRADLLKSPKDYEAIGETIPRLEYVQEQVTTLRRASSLPIVFTVRTKAQGGAFPDSAQQEAVDLLRLALQLAVEYVDVEITLPEKAVKELVAHRRFSQIIASWHDWSGGMKWDGELVKEKYAAAHRVGDIVKIVGKATSIQDNFALYNFVNKMSSKSDAKPFIAINMGLEGQMSRVLNATFSPVSHPLLPNKAAPGQLSFKQIQQALHLFGLMPARRFYLFGTPISQSMSPTLHNTGFDILGLPHHYELLETKDVGEELKMAITAPEFGGASVTIPHKLDVIPLLDKLTPAAEAIGAVNTIIPSTTSKEGAAPILMGDNTDWLGIKAAVEARLGSSKIHAGLVIGAGGTARAAIYALNALGAQTIYLFNRTKSKAEDLAAVFGDAPVKVVDSIDSWGPGLAPSVVVSTVPASALTLDTSTMDSRAMQLSSDLFTYKHGPAVVVDMAYRPAETALLKLAKQVGHSNWAVVPGLEVLLEQGYEQFKAWTGRTCPKSQVAHIVWAKYNSAA